MENNVEERQKKGQLLNLLDSCGLNYSIEPESGYLTIDLPGNIEENQGSLDNILGHLGANTGLLSNSDFLLHETKGLLVSGENISDACNTASSFFENGLLGSKDGSQNVLGTAALMANTEFDSYGQKVYNYGTGSATILINIPEKYRDLEFGLADREFAINDQGETIVERPFNLNRDSFFAIDELDIKKIPKEFIIGMIYHTTPRAERYSIDDLAKSKLIINPNYYILENHRQIMSDGRKLSNYEALKELIEGNENYNKFLAFVETYKDNQAFKNIEKDGDFNSLESIRKEKDGNKIEVDQELLDLFAALKD